MTIPNHIDYFKTLYEFKCTLLYKKIIIFFFFFEVGKKNNAIIFTNVITEVLQFFR